MFGAIRARKPELIANKLAEFCTQNKLMTRLVDQGNDASLNGKVSNGQDLVHNERDDLTSICISLNKVTSTPISNASSHDKQ